MTGFVVVDAERRLLGLLTARDLLAGEGPDRVDALMTPRERLVTADAGIGLEEARRLLTSNRVEKLPLVDADDRVQGLITLRDLALADRYPRATRDEQRAAARRGGDRDPRRLPPPRRGAASRPRPTRSCSTSRTGTRTPRSRLCRS